MSEFVTMIIGWAIMTGILAAAFAAFWFFYGRKKRSEERAIGILRQMSVFRGHIWPTNMGRHK